MPFFNRNSKHTYGEPEESSFNIFLFVVTSAVITLACFLLYALLGPVLFGSDEPEYQVVPYGEDSPTQIVYSSPVPVSLPTNAPLPTVTASPAPPRLTRITPANVHQVGPVSQFFGHSSPVNSVAFSADGRLMASGDGDGVIKLWNASSEIELYTFRSASKRVNSVVFAPDGSRLAAGGQDNLVRLWDLSNGVELAALSGPTGAVTSLAYSPTGAVLAAGSDDGNVYVWNMPGGDLVGAMRGHTSYVTSVAFSPDGTLVAAGGEDDTVRLWGFPSGAALTTLVGHTSTVSDVAFSPDGTLLATTSADHTVRLWNILSESEIATLNRHTENAHSVVFSPDGALIASAAIGIEDNTVRLWNVNTGTQVRVLYPDEPVHSVAFSPDGTRLAIGGVTFVTFWGVTGNTPVLDPTHTPAPSPVIPPDHNGTGCFLTARVNEANFRTGPGIEYDVIGQIAFNHSVQANGWMTGRDSFTWWRIEGSGGWVRGDVFVDLAHPTISDACLTLPPVDEVPPTPIVTAIPPTTPVPDTGTTDSCVLTVRMSGAVLRTGPGTSYAVIAQLSLNQPIQPNGWTTGTEGFTWWRMKGSGGWVRGDVFVDLTHTVVPDECVSLPLVKPE